MNNYYVCVLCDCRVLATGSAAVEEGRVWPCWVSITHRGTLMWGRWRGASNVRRRGGWGGRGWGCRGRAGMSGQVSRFYALRKSIEPEGVGLNHTLLLLLLLSCILSWHTHMHSHINIHTDTHSHTQNLGLATFLVKRRKTADKSFEPSVPAWW